MNHAINRLVRKAALAMGVLVAVTATVATTSATSQAAHASAAIALPPPPPAPGAYHIVTRSNGMFLYVKSDSHSNGVPVQAIRNDLSTWATLSWEVNIVGSDPKAWQIRNTTTDKCMQAMGTKVDTDVLQQPCDNRSKAQLWRLTPDPATRKADSGQGIRNDFAGYLVSPLSAEEMALTLYQPGNNQYSAMVLNYAVATDDRLFRFLKAGEH